MKSGRTLLVVSLLTRSGVVALLCCLAALTEYLNLKTAYNHPRLVELSSGRTTRVFYETADAFFTKVARFTEISVLPDNMRATDGSDPLAAAQKNGGMTWSIRLFGVPFTDPVAALSVGMRNRKFETGFLLGLVAPLTLALLFGRVFCSYICPASLLFFAIARVRRVLGNYLYFPELSMDRGFSWGVLAGGLGLAVWTGHGIWSLLLPYFAVGQTLFHGIAFGTLSISLGAILVFSALDLFLGSQFTCRYVCPTGNLLGLIGRRSVFSLQRDASRCLEGCHSCEEVCPMRVNPKRDESANCSMCGECLVICPTRCLSIGRRPGDRVAPLAPASGGLAAPREGLAATVVEGGER